MDYGILSCIPITILVVGAMLTKRIAEMMILASLTAAVLIYKSNFFSGYIEMIYGALSNSSYQFVLIILVCFGGMIKLFQESGALLGFRKVMERYGSGPRKPLLIAWAMAFVMFVDDYLNTLAVSFSIREITDKSRIPREHLAYQVNLMSACVCVLIPFSSWAAFTTGLISEQGLAFSDYLGAIPFMFYPIATVIGCLLLAAGIIPKAGALKRSYTRVEEGGPTLIEEETGTKIVDLEMSAAGRPSSPFNFFVPIVVLVGFVLLFDNDLVHGLLAAVFAQAILYLSQKIMSLTEFMKHFFEGAKSMATLAVIVCFSFMLSAANARMGFSEFLIHGLAGQVSPAMLPVLVFVIVGFATFATAGYWVMQVLTIPIFIPLAVELNVDPSLVLAAIMSGVSFGCNFCFYSDAVFMTCAGTGVSNLRQIKVLAPYVLGTVALSAMGYVAAGILL